MSHILIIGKKFSPYIEKLTSLGHTYTLLQDRLATKFPDKKFRNRVVADFSTEESLIAAVDSITQKIDGVLTTYENYVLPAAVIANHLNLPGMPVVAADACTDKDLMRSLFAKAPEKISPAFAVVTNEDELRAFASAHSFPLILKPANLAKSLLVTKNHDLEELVANYRHSVDLLETTYKKYAPNRAPKLLIEEFLEGSIHSVDAFVDSEGAPHVLNEIVDYQTGYDIGYNDNFHYSRLLPSKLSESDQAALRHCAEVGVRALGMKNSPAHIEIIMTAEGPRIVEIGARNGGYRERMHGLANGIDIVASAIATSLGDQPDLTALRHDPCAVLELFPKTPGAFNGISNQDKLESLPSLQYLSVKAKPGAHVGKAADGYKMCAVVILHNGDHEQFDRDLAFVNENVYVTTL
jgi:biotin carboxylase